MPQNETYNNEIIEIVKNYRFSYATILNSNKFKHLHDYIYEFTKEFSDLSFPARIYWTLNDIHEYPRCQNPRCPVPGGKELRHDIRYRPLSGHNEHHCCSRCAQQDPETQKTMILHSLDKYGYEHPQQHPDKRKAFSEKLKSLPLEHWDNALNKRVATNLREHSVINVSLREDVKAKVSLTWDEKTDEEVNDITVRTKSTKLERFGNENFVNPEKAYETRIEKYGSFWSEESWNLRKKTNLERYGVEEPNQTSEARAKYRMINRLKCRPHIYRDILENDEFVEPLFTLEEFINHDEKKSKLKWRCKKCGREFEQNHGDHLFKVNAYVRCLHCFPLLAAKSLAEKDISTFIRECIEDLVICNSRKIICPKELDIYMPKRKLAIEIDGTFWHSINQETPISYHIEKQDMCFDKKIHLLHIYDVEWLSSPDRVKHFIRSLLNIYDNRMLASKCTLSLISKDEFHTFISENSLVHEIFTVDHIGIFSNNLLIAACSLEFDYNLHHTLIHSLCYRAGVKVSGALREIAKWIKNNYKDFSIEIFYVLQRRFGDHRTSYLALGFVFDHLTPPNLILWDRKKKQLCLITVDSESYMKEVPDDIIDIAMKRNDDNKIYTILDSGNLVFRYLIVQ